MNFELNNYFSFALSPTPEDLPVTKIDEILTCIMTLMARHFDEKSVKWFSRVVESSILLAHRCSLDILGTHMVPMMDEMRERCVGLWNQEYQLSNSWNNHQDEFRYEAQEMLTEVLDECYQVFVKDFTSLLPFLSVFLHSKNEKLRQLCSQPEDNEDICCDVQALFASLSDIFQCWSTSQYFKREFQTSLHQLSNQIKVVMTSVKVKCADYFNSPGAAFRQPPGQMKLQPEKQPNFILLCLELLLPVADKLLSKEDKQLMGYCSLKLGMKGVIVEDLKVELINKFEARELRSQKLTHKLVRSLSYKLTSAPAEKNRSYEEKAVQILNLAKIKHKVLQAEKGRVAQKRWKHLFSRRKRKAVISCFLAVPFFKLSKHNAINLFLHVYCREWLATAEQTSHQLLTEELLDHQDYLAVKRIRDNDRRPRHEQKQLCEMDFLVDPLSQLFKMMQRLASSGEIINEHLYTAYAGVLEKSIMQQQEEDSQGVEDDPTGAYEVYTERKAQLIAKQAQLADRGAPTTLISIITAANGEKTAILHSTLLLGIALLKEGNLRIQSEMLLELNAVDVGFLQSISKLISKCSVLDWNAYERFNKSDVIQTTHNEAMCKVLPDFNLAISLFRFLQLLCEGHNLSFQNYLRTQAGNTTTVNIIVYTVDYLLRLQESISDFYWHYSDYQTIDLSGRENFLKAFKVAKQVFRTLTEYIQGPCVKNQDTLAHSRLWDAVSGFIHIFAVLQRKLYKDTSQLELLRELLGLQEEMFILLLSMLEGSAMSSTIGKLMLDMLMESIHHIEDIMAFFGIFVKLKDSATSKAFKEYDLNRDGFISYREFEKAMEAQQRYTKEEIAYLMECADLNKDGLLDYLEFTERFHQPAENIGFHLCVLIVHLTDHLPNDKRVNRLKVAAQCRELLEHFEKNMGCIEIQGKSGRIERVYFEVKDTRLQQWQEAQIQASRRMFLHSVEMGSQKNKLQGFMSFCDETIFEMNYSDKISCSAQTAMKARAVKHRSKHNTTLQHKPQPFMSRVKARVTAFQEDYSSFNKLLALLQVLWLFLLLRLWPSVRNGLHHVWTQLPAYLASIKTRLGHLLPRHKQPPPPPPSITTTGSPTSDTTTHPVKKPTKRPPNLQINITSPPVQHSLRLRATTTTTCAPAPLKIKSKQQIGVVAVEADLWQRGASKRARGSLVMVPEKVRISDNGTPRRGSLQPDYGRGVSVGGEETRGSYSYTPRNFKPVNLTLTYNRSRMKRPSDAGTPSPMEEGPSLKQVASEDSYIPKIAAHTKNWSSFLARNYYRLHNLKMAVTLLINIILLTYQVKGFPEADSDNTIDLFDPFWTPILLTTASFIHFFLSAIHIISYYYLKIPLVIFKREKHIAHELEKNHLWVTAKPLETWTDWWDQIVVGAASFPRNYWDKQVKQRVYESVVTSDKSSVARVMGMEVKSKFEKRARMEQAMEMLLSLIDVRYCVWTIGVTISNPICVYHMLYCLLSFVGLKWNSFYFSIHLLAFVLNFKLLRTVLNSVLLNGKQLAMTFLMTCVVIYIYTVIAFNFLRKFYQIETPEGEKVFKCDSMLQCFVFHIDQGMRSGGGIADVLEPASGDPYETLRLLFDFTFFFIVVIILLAIIQGLIIDAFGELRDKEETLTNEMQTKCFVCSLPKSEFDHIPHGFDNHLRREHNMAHYMFFMMYLIKKKESEFSGQESYVWEKYLQQSMDFFPVGDCFQSQEERTLAAAASRAAVEGRGHQGSQKKSAHDQQKHSLHSPIKKSNTMFL